MSVKQVIVMRKDLNMRKGKMCAQAAHASISFMTQRLRKLDQITQNSDEDGAFYELILTKNEMEWVKDGFTKICVGVDSEKELMEVWTAARKAKLEVHLITDAGHTEFGGVPTKTCLAIGPDDAEAIDAVTGHLKLL